MYLNKKIEYRNSITLIKKKEYVEQRINNSKNSKREVWSVIKEETNKAVTEWNWSLVDTMSNVPIQQNNLPDYINDNFV